MNKRRFLFLLLSAAFALATTACKKSDGNATPTTVSAPYISPYIYGTMTIIVNNIQYHPRDTIAIQSEAIASFHSDSNSNTNVPAGNVTLNGDSLFFNQLFYVGPYNKSANGEIIWVVQGSLSIPSIDYSSAEDFPDYNANIPDTFFIINGISLDVSGSVTNNADSVIIKLYNPFNGNTSTIYSGNAPALVFTSASLDFILGMPVASAYSQDLVTLTISTIKFDYKIIDGKTYEFVSRKNIIRGIYLR